MGSVTRIGPTRKLFTFGDALDAFKLVKNALSLLKFVQIGHLLLSFVVPVEPKLEEKDRIKEDRSDRQNELHEVEGARLEEWSVKEDRLNRRLEEGQGAAREVKTDILDGPAFRALALPIEVDLGQVLGEGDGGLGVAHHEEGIG